MLIFILIIYKLKCTLHTNYLGWKFIKFVGKKINYFSSKHSVFIDSNICVFRGRESRTAMGIPK